MSLESISSCKSIDLCIEELKLKKHILEIISFKGNLSILKQSFYMQDN